MPSRFILALAGLIFLSGCATPIIHDTPSGKVEDTIASSNVKAIKAEIVNRMINLGFTIQSESEYVISFDKPVSNAVVAALLGSQYNATPNARISYTFVRADGGTRVIADLAIITNPGSAFERRTDLNNGQDSPKVQAMLDSIKSEFPADAGAAK